MWITLDISWIPEETSTDVWYTALNTVVQKSFMFIMYLLFHNLSSRIFSILTNYRFTPY